MTTYRIYDEGYDFEDDNEFFDSVVDAVNEILRQYQFDPGLADFPFMVESSDGEIPAIVYHGLVFLPKDEIHENISMAHETATMISISGYRDQGWPEKSLTNLTNMFDYHKRITLAAVRVVENIEGCE